MRIVVVGAGKLGYSIASLLADGNYDVVVIESDEKRREVVNDSLDVLTICGSGCSEEVLSDPEVKGADVLVATTDSDEVNMITCFMAKKHGVKHTVARVRNTDYDRNAKELLEREMKIDLVLNPERVLASEINHILLTPSALDVDEFADGKVRMFEAKIADNSELIGQPLKDLNLETGILVAMIFRKSKMIIPHGNDIIEAGDNVYFVGKQEIILELENRFNKHYKKLERAMIMGAGRTGRFLAPLLEKQGVFVKVIEKDKDRCQQIAEQLQDGIVLCGDATDIDLLVNEGISEADVVICLTDDDKMNLLFALMSKHLGAQKTIVRVARNEYVGLMEKVGVDIVLSSRLLSAAEVLRFVRRGGLVSVSLLEGAKAEALELHVPEKCAIAGKTLLAAALPRECLVCTLVRDNEAYVPNGNSVLKGGDRVIIFAQSEVVSAVMALFEDKA